ncbi:hypothetical protein AAHE18_19G008900 [Arachis hypogaea]
MFLRKHGLFLLLTTVVVLSATTAISPGSTLSATSKQTWSSSSSTFFLGFVPVNPPTTPPTFTASIFYSGNSPVVWSAANATPVDSGASLRFLSSGALRLLNGSGATVWDSGTANRGASSATLEDSGNLVISNGSRTPLWQSFDHPTDTLVPSQNFSSGKILRSGSYSFTLQSNGNLTLYWNDSILYWNHGLNSSVNAVSKPVLALQSIGILQLSDTNLTGAAIVAYSSDYAEGGSDVLRVLKLDNDGNLRIYSTSKGSGNPTARWAAVEDQCEVYAYCGNYGICSYNASNPVCGCPSQNFEMVDPNDSRKGCRRKVSLNNCQGNATMLTLNHAQLLTYYPEDQSQEFFIGISACKGNCLSNTNGCFASTALGDGTGQCYLKSQDLVSGYVSPALPSTSYIKVCPPVLQNPPPSGVSVKHKSSRVPAWVVVVVVLGTVLALVAFEGGLWMWCCRNNKRFGALSAQYALLEYASGAPVQFSYKELERATKGFKEKLGAGGFGAVYRGILVNKTVAAVKQLEGIEQEEHSGKLLNWEYRYSVALGTARGITYLHEECRDCIVHCDIKPENILLDENYVSKVSDFGLAKLVNPKDHRHRTLTSVRGTRGYLAPEWLANLPITSKSDVYSYGMVLLEIVSGRRNFEVSEETNRKKFSIWAYEEFEKGNIIGIVDKRLADQEVDMAQVTRAIQASFWCIQEQPSHRPTMSRVVQMLEGVAEIERPPAPRLAMEGPVVSGTSTNISSNVSAFSTAAASPLGPSSSSSFQTSSVSTLTLGRNTEKVSSSLLQSEP